MRSKREREAMMFKQTQYTFSPFFSFLAFSNEFFLIPIFSSHLWKVKESSRLPTYQASTTTTSTTTMTTTTITTTTTFGTTYPTQSRYCYFYSYDVFICFFFPIRMTSRPKLPPPAGADSGSRDKVPEFLQTPVFHSYRPGKSFSLSFPSLMRVIVFVVVLKTKWKS